MKLDLHKSFALLVAMLLEVLPRAASAQSADLKRMRFAEQGTNLVVTTSFTGLFDQKAYEDLSSGVPTSVVVRLYVYARGGDRELPVSFTIASFRVVYDLWDETYVLDEEGPMGRKSRKIEQRADVLRALTMLSRYPIAPLSRIGIGPHYFLAMVVELNPVEQEFLAETRRWLSKRSDERFDSGSSFFGSFVSVFVNPKIQEADRMLRLRSQPFYRVQR